VLANNSKACGVSAKGLHRIQYDFMLDGARYRPTLPRAPTEANLKRSRTHLEDIKARIKAGTFIFEEEFPDYRHMERVIDPSQIRSCNQVFDQFLEHCEARLARHDLAASTLSTYRRIIDNLWRPELCDKLFLKIDHLTLNRIADRNKRWSKKHYNNAISVLRRAFAFGYRNHPDKPNPALGLRCCRMTRKDRPRPDPFRIQDAEKLIAQIHRDWGEAQGNYDEFRFFTGLRPSEQIALTVSDFDPVRGTLTVNKARVNGVHKNSTKTGHDRLFELCPRALAVLVRHLRLRERLVAEGRIPHDHLFFRENGEPIQNLVGGQRRWRLSLKRTGIRRRRPYCARHSSVSWSLMIGKNPLWVARQHGHSVRTMLEIYAAWAEGAVESDVAAIAQAMGLAPHRNSVGLLGSLRRLFTRSSLLDIQVKKPGFSIWHWICHQKRGLCS
jgi:integrase